jgi:hypothetical protein
VELKYAGAIYKEKCDGKTQKQHDEVNIEDRWGQCRSKTSRQSVRDSGKIGKLIMFFYIMGNKS